MTDLLIDLAYVTISMLYKLTQRIKIAFSAVVLCFGLFIAACGATHFLEVWTLWHPDYWIAAGVKVFTVLASVATAIFTRNFMTLQGRNIIGQTLEELFPAADHLKFMAHYDRIMTTGIPARTPSSTL